MTGLNRKMAFPYILITSMLLLVASLACSSLSNPEGWSGGVLVGDSIVIGSMDGQVLSLNVETGEHNWEPALIRVDDKNKNRRAIYGTPLVQDNVIFVTSYDGKVHAFSMIDGNYLKQSQSQTNLWVGFHTMKIDFFLVPVTELCTAMM